MDKTSHLATDQSEFTPPGPVSGPSAWYGNEMQSDSTWVHPLNETEIAEIEHATDTLLRAKTDIATISRSNFPLPTLAKKLAVIAKEVVNGRGFALMRGMPVAKWSLEKSAAAYFGVGTYLGNARSQNAMGHVLGHVRDVGRDAENDPTARIYQTTERQTFHTDSCDIVGLLCLRTAKTGGYSSLVSSMTLYNEVLKRRPDLAVELFKPMQSDRRGEVPAGKKPWHSIPVYNWHEGFLSAHYARRYINSARRFDEVPPLTKAQTEALDLIDELANDPQINLQMQFEPGDMQWVHNHTMLHDRTAYEDWDEPEKKRHLLRLWLAAPNARPLPPIYADRWGSVTIGDRGGIIVPGTRLNAPLEPA